MARFTQHNLLNKLAQGSNRGIAKELKYWFLRNIKINRDYFQRQSWLCIPFEELYKKHIWQPFILVAGGDSYRKEINILANAPDIFVIACVDRIAGNLLNAGVKVNYIFCVDVESKPIEADTSNSHLIFDMATNPELVIKFKGKRTYYRTQYPPEIELEAQRMCAGDAWCPFLGGNVSTAMFAICRDWLCAHSIAFVGHDFCYDTKRPQDTDFPVYIDGKQKWTYPGYWLFKLWTEEKIDSCDKEFYRHRYVNCSLDGLLGRLYQKEDGEWEFLDSLERMSLTQYIQEETERYYELKEIEKATFRCIVEAKGDILLKNEIYKDNIEYYVEMIEKSMEVNHA